MNESKSKNKLRVKFGMLNRLSLTSLPPSFNFAALVKDRIPMLFLT